MTDDELRERLDEVRQYGLGWVAIPTDDFGRLIDLLPPADDGEPVTTDWLLSVGFVVDPKDEDCLLIPIPKEIDQKVCISALDWSLAALEGDGVSLSDFVPLGGATAPTRGHVRRLCAALGITLTESDRDRQGA